MNAIDSLNNWNNWEMYFKENLQKDLRNNKKDIIIYLYNKKQSEQCKIFSINIKKTKNNIPYNNKSLYKSSINKELPIFFPINQSISYNIFQKESDKVKEAKGRFYNKIFICEDKTISDNIYIFFLLDKNDKLRQGYILIKDKDKENNILDNLKNNSLQFIEYINNKNLDNNKYKINNKSFYLFIEECNKYNKTENKNIENNNYIINTKIKKSFIYDNNNNNNINETLKPKKIIVPRNKRACSAGRKRIPSINPNIDGKLDYEILLPKKAIHRESIPGVIGLQKIGICSMNAVIQCFSNLIRFKNILLDRDIYKELEKNKESNMKVSFALAEVLKNLWENLKIRVYAPWHFKEVINEIKEDDPIILIYYLLKTMNQELNNPIINNILYNKKIYNKEECNTNINFNSSLITKEFSGINKFYSFCYNCQYSNCNFNYFYYLVFPLKEVIIFLKRNLNIIRLNECFEYFANYENYTNNSYCNKCKNYSLVRKNFFSYCPPILILNLKQDFNNIRVVFEEQLNLIFYMENKETPYCNYNYELTGLISLNEDNNYISYCKNKNGWYKYNDAKVTKTSFNLIREYVLPSVLFYSYIEK